MSGNLVNDTATEPGACKEKGRLDRMSETEIEWKVNYHWLHKGQKLIRSPKFSAGGGDKYHLDLEFYKNHIRMVLFQLVAHKSDGIQVTLTAFRYLEKFDGIFIRELGQKTGILTKRTISVSGQFPKVCPGEWLPELVISCDIRPFSYISSKEIPQGHTTLDEILINSGNDEKPTTVTPRLVKCNEMSVDFGTLFESKKFSDLTLIGKGRIFRVHCAVLAARSPVFAAMIQKDVTISALMVADFSTKVVEEFLRYVYTCETGDLELEIALDLFAAAEKFQLMGLKNKCCRLLCEDMTSDVALKILMKVDIPRDEALTEAATQKIASDISNVMKTAEWLIFLKTQPEMANSVIQRCINKEL